MLTHFEGVKLEEGQEWRGQETHERYRLVRGTGNRLYALELHNNDGYVYENLEIALDGCVVVVPKPDPNRPEFDAFGMERVLSEVGLERIRQNQKWGEQNHGPMVWLGILAEEFGEAARDVNEFHFANGDKAKAKKHGKQYREELVQVAAVAVAMIESYDRNEGGEG